MELNKIAFERSLKTAFFQGMRRAVNILAQGIILWIASLLYTQGNIVESQDAILIAIFSVIYCSNNIGASSQYMPDIARARKSGAILFDIL